MSEKLFYNVPKDKADSFKSSKQNAIGFVEEYTDAKAGYIIANGTEFGRTRVSSSANSFSVNGTQYSIILNKNGELSVSKYIATSISSFTVIPSNEIKGISYNISGTTGTSTSAITNKVLYIGDTYSFTTSISGTVTVTTKAVISNETSNEFTVNLTYFNSTKLSPITSSETSYTIEVTHEEELSYTYTISGTASWGTNPKLNSTNYKLSKSDASITVTDGTNTSNETAYAYVNTLGVNTSVHAVFKSGVSNVYTENADGTIVINTPSSGAARITSITIPAGVPVFVFPQAWGTPTFKQLGATDTGWTELATKTHKTPNKGTCPCKIYTHGQINSEGTWSVSW